MGSASFDQPHRFNLIGMIAPGRYFKLERRRTQTPLLMSGWMACAFFIAGLRLLQSLIPPGLPFGTSADCNPPHEERRNMPLMALMCHLRHCSGCTGKCPHIAL